jgi:hypothetical protein
MPAQAMGSREGRASFVEVRLVCGLGWSTMAAEALLFASSFCCSSESVSEVLSSSVSWSSSGSVSWSSGVLSSLGVGSRLCGAFAAVDEGSTGPVMVVIHDVGLGGRM